MSKAEEAFSRAAMCADQAQAAQDEERRTFFKRLRDFMDARGEQLSVRRVPGR